MHDFFRYKILFLLDPKNSHKNFILQYRLRLHQSLWNSVIQ